MVRLLVGTAIAAAFGLFALFNAGGRHPGEAEAFQLHSFRWPTPVLGVSTTDPRLQSYLDEGMALWANASGLTVSPGDDIVLVTGELKPPVHYAGQSAQANVAARGGVIQQCEVRVAPDAFFALAEGARRAVIAHELGHCLGVDHSEVASIMKNPFFYPFNADDMAAIRSLYPAHQVERQNLAHRLYLPVVGAN